MRAKKKKKEEDVDKQKEIYCRHLPHRSIINLHILTIQKATEKIRKVHAYRDRCPGVMLNIHI